MKIHNVRLDPACNSSSTHSVIFLNKEEIESFCSSDDYCGDGYGWSNFTLVTRDGKLHYLATSVAEYLKDYMGLEDIENIIKNIFGDDILPSLEDSYVDHQSQLCFPRNWEGTNINIQFIKEYVKYISDTEGIVILGGNDNDDGHHLRNEGTSINFELPVETSAEYYAKKDDLGYWSLYNFYSGGKIRLSFKTDDFEITKSSLPELVDISLTDKCSMGCLYCYMGSTKDGNHASKEYLTKLAKVLGGSQVFECCIGGGEPLESPDFGFFIKELRANGIKAVNFTTRRLEWLKDPALVEAYMGENGCFAFSIDSAKDLQRLSNAIREAGYKIGFNAYGVKTNINVTAQYVMGSSTEEVFRAIVLACQREKIPLTLLGYKTTGRGETCKPHNYDNWFSILKEFKLDRIRIDTTLAKQYKDLLKQEGMPDFLYHTEEGKYSCFINAVDQTLHSSSYERYHNPIDLKDIDQAGTTIGYSKYLELKYKQMQEKI